MTGLRHLIKEFLVLEAAASASAASSKGFALVMQEYDLLSAFVLYDTNYYLSQLKKLKSEDDNLKFEDAERVFEDPAGVVGVIFTDSDAAPCYHSATVAQSAASEGFGPLIYDIAMSYSPDKTLSPDRDSVTPGAYEVWKYYYHKRNDVSKKKFDNVKNPITPPEEDDCEVFSDPKRYELNFAYSKQSSTNISGLVSNHNDLMDQLPEIVGKQMDFNKPIKEALLTAANEYFSGKYKSQRNAAL